SNFLYFSLNLLDNSPFKKAIISFYTKTCCFLNVEEEPCILKLCFKKHTFIQYFSDLTYLMRKNKNHFKKKSTLKSSLSADLVLGILEKSGHKPLNYKQVASELNLFSHADRELVQA